MFAKFGCTSLLFPFVVFFVVLVRLAWFYLTDYMIVRFGEENPGLIAGAQGGQTEDGNNAHLQVLGCCDGGDYEEREEAGDSFNCSENMDRDNRADRHSEL